MVPSGITKPRFYTQGQAPRAKKCHFYAFWYHYKCAQKKSYLYFCQKIVFTAPTHLQYKSQIRRTADLCSSKALIPRFWDSQGVTGSDRPKYFFWVLIIGIVPRRNDDDLLWQYDCFGVEDFFLDYGNKFFWKVISWVSGKMLDVWIKKVAQILGLEADLLNHICEIPSGASLIRRIQLWDKKIIPPPPKKNTVCTH